MSFEQIKNISIQTTVPAHLYLWVPNSKIPNGLVLLDHWGFRYKTNIVLYGISENTNYFRDVTGMFLFGIKGKNARTLSPGRRQVNFINNKNQIYKIIESCSPGPWLELFGSEERMGWTNLIRDETVWSPSDIIR